MGIKDFIIKKAVIATVKLVGIENAANGMRRYTEKRLIEKLQQPSSSNAIDSGLGPSRDTIIQFLITGTPFVASLSSQLTTIGLNTMVEYYKIPPDKIPANLTQNLLLKSIDLSETTKNLLAYLKTKIPSTPLPEDIQELLDRYDYDIKVYLNDIAASVAKDAFVHLTPEIVSEHYIGKFLKLFMSQDNLIKNISNQLEKVVDQVVPQELIKIDHGKAGKYTLTDVEDDWILVDLEKPTLTGLLTKRATSTWSGFTGILGGIKDILVGKKTNTETDDLPKVTKNWFRDNDYPKLVELKEIYQLEKDKIHTLKNELNKLLEQLQLLENNIKDIKPGEIENLKNNLDRIHKDLDVIDKELKIKLDDFNAKSNFDNKNRVDDFRVSADKIITDQCVDAAKTIDEIGTKITKISNLKDAIMRDSQFRANSTIFNSNLSYTADIPNPSIPEQTSRLRNSPDSQKTS